MTRLFCSPKTPHRLCVFTTNKSFTFRMLHFIYIYIYIYINIDRVKPQVTYRGSLICKTHLRFDFDHFYGSWELFLYLFIIKKNWQKRNNFRLVEKFSCFSKRKFFLFCIIFLKS